MPHRLPVPTFSPKTYNDRPQCVCGLARSILAWADLSVNAIYWLMRRDGLGGSGEHSPAFRTPQSKCFWTRSISRDGTGHIMCGPAVRVGGRVGCVALIVASCRMCLSSSVAFLARVRVAVSHRILHGAISDWTGNRSTCVVRAAPLVAKSTFLT